MEKIETSWEELRSKYIVALSKQPFDPSSSSNFKSAKRTHWLRKPQLTSDWKNKMILVNDKDYLEGRLNLDKPMASTGTS